MRGAWRLLVVLALLGAAALAMRLAPQIAEPGLGLALWALPPSLAGFTGSEGAPESALPVDPNETLGIRRAYRQGSQTAWVSVALFSRQHEPGRRPSISLVYPERSTSFIERTALPISLNGRPGTAMSLPTVVVHRGKERLVVAYWYQIGREPFASPYLYRAALLRSILFARRADAALVRIAVAAAEGEALESSLGVVTRLAPSLYSAVNHALDR